MIDTQITTLSRLEKIYGATDIWGNQWSWLTISPDRCALSIPSDSWIDTLSKYQKKEVLTGGCQKSLSLQQTDIRTIGTIGATDHYRKRPLKPSPAPYLGFLTPHGVDQGDYEGYERAIEVDKDTFWNDWRASAKIRINKFIQIVLEDLLRVFEVLTDFESIASSASPQ